MELTILAVGVLMGVLAVFGGKRIFRKNGSPSPKEAVGVQIFVEKMRALGELIVFKAYTKEIVTAAEHWFGEWGKRYLTWLISNKKMAMVFAFEINFWYDLRSAEFNITPAGDGRFIIKMPRCLYDISIKDIGFYDEQRAKFLPWLIPGLLSEAFGAGPNEEDRNRLKNEALKQASFMADRLIQRLSSEIEKSAQQTMEMLAKSFGARSVTLDFTASKPQQRNVTDISSQQAA
jgi:hypothetical protein